MHFYSHSSTKGVRDERGAGGRWKWQMELSGRSKPADACHQHHLSLTICLLQPFSRNDSSVSRAATSETATSAEQSKRIQCHPPASPQAITGCCSCKHFCFLHHGTHEWQSKKKNEKRKRATLSISLSSRRGRGSPVWKRFKKRLIQGREQRTQKSPRSWILSNGLII